MNENGQISAKSCHNFFILGMKNISILKLNYTSIVHIPNVKCTQFPFASIYLDDFKFIIKEIFSRLLFQEPHSVKILSKKTLQKTLISRRTHYTNVLSDMLVAMKIYLSDFSTFFYSCLQLPPRDKPFPSGIMFEKGSNQNNFALNT